MLKRTLVAITLSTSLINAAWAIKINTTNRHLQYIALKILNDEQNTISLDHNLVHLSNNKITYCKHHNCPDFQSNCGNKLTPSQSCQLWFYATPQSKLGASNTNLTLRIGKHSYKYTINSSNSIYALWSRPGAYTNNLARYAGAQWQTVGTFAYGRLYADTLHNGDLYVGGNNISNVNSVPLQGIARWNGEQWSSVGNGLDGGRDTINTLLSWHHKLYAGGDFDRSGDNHSVRYIARLDTTSGPIQLQYWTGIANNQINGDVSALIVFHKHIYAAGAFKEHLHHLAKLNGQTWQAVAQGIVPQDPDDYASAETFATYRKHLVIGGLFTTIDEPHVLHSVAILQHNLLNPLRDGFKDSVVFSAIALHNKLYIAGHMLDLNDKGNNIYSWNGKKWQVVAPNAIFKASYILQLLTLGNTIYASGTFTTANGNHLAKLVHNKWQEAGAAPTPFAGADGSFVKGMVTAASIDTIIITRRR